jgi:pyruvate dehydrogenase E1 component alpha subunit
MPRLAICGGLSQYRLEDSGQNRRRKRKHAVTTATCPATVENTTADRERALYTTMLRLRRFEEKAGMLYAMGTIAVPCPLGYGQEAALAAVADALQPQDVLVSLAALPGLELALGTSPLTVFQRLAGSSDAAGAPQALLHRPGEVASVLNRPDPALVHAAGRAGASIVLATGAGELAQFLAPSGDKLLAILMVPSDRRPDTSPLPAGMTVRECDGAHLDAISANLAAARDALAAGEGHLALMILTPPYAGHARDPGRRPAARRDSPDPIALYRHQIVSTGRITDPEACAIESAIRDEIAASARAITLACAP